MKSRTWSTISTPGRQILGPGRRFLVLVDDSSDPIDFSRRFPLLVDKFSDPVNFSRRFQVQIDDSSDPIEKTTLWSFCFFFFFFFFFFLFLFLLLILILIRARACGQNSHYTHPPLYSFIALFPLGTNIH